ncbi:MAG: hypothetical protein HRT89_01920 [Lentisphaeria bacterium]|nr:hypothetical protein [Lentisphaeria bacterium]NQZ66804.1 hypothetical protein [Lentisphaeria bacterium]
MFVYLRTWGLIFLSFLFSHSLCAEENTSVAQDPNWATATDLAGLEKSHQINGRLHRSGPVQPGQIPELYTAGIRLLINLSTKGFDKEVDLPDGMVYLPISMLTWKPDNKQIKSFLQAVLDPMNADVLVFCEDGGSKTGIMIAIHRVVVDQWTTTDALAEMQSKPYEVDLTTDELNQFLNTLDIESIREGLPSAMHGETKRFLGNLKVLLKSNWKGSLWFAARFVGAITLWGILGLILGLIVGILTFVLIRRKKRNGSSCLTIGGIAMLPGYGRQFFQSVYAWALGMQVCGLVVEAF